MLMIIETRHETEITTYSIMVIMIHFLQWPTCMHSLICHYNIISYNSESLDGYTIIYNKNIFQMIIFLMYRVSNQIAISHHIILYSDTFISGMERAIAIKSC